jgi:hypothetical protein
MLPGHGAAGTGEAAHGRSSPSIPCSERVLPVLVGSCSALTTRKLRDAMFTIAAAVWHHQSAAFAQPSGRSDQPSGKCGTKRMKGKYTRIFADADGVSHFEDLEMELLPGFAVPPAEPLYSAEFVRLGQCRWVGGSTDWMGGTPHPNPRRMLVVVVSGKYEVIAGDGTVRSFKAGDVTICEDTWGTGHSSRIIEDSIGLFIDLSEAS